MSNTLTEEITALARVSETSERVVGRVLDDLKVRTVDQLQFVKAEDLIERGIPPVCARQFAHRWAAKTEKESNKLPSELLACPYADPYKQSPRKWIEWAEELLSANGYPKLKWPRAIALAIDGSLADVAEAVREANTWEEAKAMFLKKAQDETVRGELGAKWRSLRSGNFPSLTTFIDTFRDYAERGGTDLTSAETMEVFRLSLQGLDKLVMAAQPPVNHLDEALRQLKDNRADDNARKLFQMTTRGTTHVATTSSGKRRGKLEAGIGPDHVAPQSGPPEEVTCFNCKERGHYRGDCPKLNKRARVIAFLQDILDDGETKEDME